MAYYKIHLTWNILKQGEKYCTTRRTLRPLPNPVNFCWTQTHKGRRKKGKRKFELRVKWKSSFFTNFSLLSNMCAISPLSMLEMEKLKTEPTVTAYTYTVLVHDS